MKFFVFGGMMLGLVVTLAGAYWFADQIQYVLYGVPVYGTVTGFEETSESPRGGNSAPASREKSIFYPIIEYTYEGNHYEHRHRVKQYDTMRPFSNGENVMLLCSARTPQVPFVGTFYQLMTSKMLAVLIGLSIMLVCGLIGAIAWLYGNLIYRRVQPEPDWESQFDLDLLSRNGPGI